MINLAKILIYLLILTLIETNCYAHSFRYNRIAFKPGECPKCLTKYSSNICENKCRNDYSCPGAMICCKTACGGAICRDPIFSDGPDNTFAEVTSTGRYNAIARGQVNNYDFRIYIENRANDRIVSPIHDIPTEFNKNNFIYNMVVENAKFSNTRYAIDPSITLNPIIHQRLPNGSLDFVTNYFPAHGHLFNMGSVPQTWTDIIHTDLDNLLNDPNIPDIPGEADTLDIIDVGATPLVAGTVVQVKVLGAILFEKDAKVDFKLVGINVNDPEAAFYTDLSVLMQETLWVDGIAAWLEFQGFFPIAAISQAEIIPYIDAYHQKWLDLFRNRVKTPNLVNTENYFPELYRISGDESRCIVDYLNPFNPKPAIENRNIQYTRT